MMKMYTSKFNYIDSLVTCEQLLGTAMLAYNNAFTEINFGHLHVLPFWDNVKDLIR